MTDLEREDVGRVREWYNLVADAFVRRYDGESGWYLARCEEDLVHAVCALEGRDVLDLGTGHGRLLPGLRARARRVVGVDVAEALLQHARGRQVGLAQMDARDLGFRAGSFDVVIALGLFEYVADLGRFLREISRVTRSGGTLAFTYHQRAVYRTPGREPPESAYFGRTVAERARFWEKQRHRRRDVRAALENAGFRPRRHYRLFFRASGVVHTLGYASRERSAARRAVRAAVPVVERALGRSMRVLTQHSTGTVLVVAERAASDRAAAPCAAPREAYAWR